MSSHNCKVDRFGFITNLDNNGKLVTHDKIARTDSTSGDDIDEETKRMERREKKWSAMMNSWGSTNRRRQRLILSRLRKGLPDSMRHKVWPLLGGANKKLQPGRSTSKIYDELLEQCEQDNQIALDNFPPEGPNKSQIKLTKSMRSNSFQNIQETIERDIHRTYPRHSLFYDEENHRDDLVTTKEDEKPKEEGSQLNRNSNDTNGLENGDDNDDDDDDANFELGGLCNEDLSLLMSELDVGSSHLKKKLSTGSNATASSKRSNDGDEATKAAKAAASTAAVEQQQQQINQTFESILEAKGGQGALRRVLCAYSYYDREVGYCQGMNFIAAMFITIMSEKEAFWMLVAVMNDSPCYLRGLFGKGMTETHKVLHVAEKLIHHFLPKLGKHLDKENIHVTMYATQWLLTQYTSSFHFDLVTRVWDCFLVEGFKAIYRVMLALLQQSQPALLKMSFEEILGYFRELPDKVEGTTVMETAMKIPLKRKHIVKYENEWKAKQEGNN